MLDVAAAAEVSEQTRVYDPSPTKPQELMPFDRDRGAARSPCRGPRPRDQAAPACHPPRRYGGATLAMVDEMSAMKAEQDTKQASATSGSEVLLSGRTLRSR